MCGLSVMGPQQMGINDSQLLPQSSLPTGIPSSSLDISSRTPHQLLKFTVVTLSPQPAHLFQKALPGHVPARSGPAVLHSRRFTLAFPPDGPQDSTYRHTPTPNPAQLLCLSCQGLAPLPQGVPRFFSHPTSSPAP